MSLPDSAIQSSVFVLLDAALSVPVYDDVPEGASRPYVVISDLMTTPDNRHGEFSYQTVLTVHVWSEYRGNSEAMNISEEVVSLLDHKPLAVEGFHHVVTRYEFSQVMKDPGELELRHAPVRFRILTEDL